MKVEESTICYTVIGKKATPNFKENEHKHIFQENTDAQKLHGECQVMKKITPCNLLRVTEKHKKTYHIQSLGTGIVVALQSSEATNIELATGCNSWLSIWCHSSKDSLIDHVPVTLK